MFIISLDSDMLLPNGLGFCFMAFMAHEILGDMSNLVLSTESCKPTCLLGNSKFNRLYTILYNIIQLYTYIYSLSVRIWKPAMFE